MAFGFCVTFEKILYSKVILKFHVVFFFSSCCLVAKSCLTLWDPMNYIAYQAPLSMGFPRQEYWSGLSFPSPGDLPNPEIKPGSPAWQVILSHQGSPFLNTYKKWGFALLGIYLDVGCEIYSTCHSPYSYTVIPHDFLNNPSFPPLIWKVTFTIW